MRFSRRIPFSLGAPILALVLLLSATVSLTPTVAAQTSNAAAAPPGAAIQNQGAASPSPTAEEAWNEAAGALAAKILEHMTSGKTLALTVRNISSLGDDDVLKVRRALRTQLRSQKARLTTSKQAKVDVQVTLSENTEGYLWIAEIRDHSSLSALGEDAATPVVMVWVTRASPGERCPTSEPLSIRKIRIFQQSDPMLDIALLDNPTVGAAKSPAPAGAAARILVLGLDGVSLYEQAETPDTDGKSVRQWRPKQSAPLTRLRPWPRDARGRIMVRPDSLFDAYLPGTKCTGALEPVLTLECHESDEPWPLVGGEREGNSANSGAGVGPAGYFSADRNFFDGRVKLDDDGEMKMPPFLAAVIMPLNAATHAELPTLPGRVPPGATGVPGWVLSGLDGRAQLLNSNAKPVADIGGWGSQIVGLQSGCGAGWQVLASQARDLNEADAVQAYEIVNRKPVPVSTPIEFAGPIIELWPLADGSEAIAISRNLQTEAYEAFRLSVSCGQ